MRLALSSPDAEVDRAEGAQEQALQTAEETLHDEERARSDRVEGQAAEEPPSDAAYQVKRAAALSVSVPADTSSKFDSTVDALGG